MLFDTASAHVTTSKLVFSALAPSHFPDTYLTRDHGPELASVFPTAPFAFAAGMRDLIKHVLTEPKDAAPFRTIWPYLRQASGDTPLDPELAELAEGRIVDLDLLATPDGVEHGLHLIASVAALAAANGWKKLKEPIDAAVDAIWLRSGEVEHRSKLLFEIMYWRARMEEISFERCRIFAGALRRIAANPEERDWAIDITRRFATTLSGSDTAPFIDLLGEIRD